MNISSSLFNNDGDSVRLLTTDKTARDSFEYGTSTQGKTFAKVDIYGESVCLQEPSKGIQNTGCINEETTSASVTTTQSQTAATAKNTIKKQTTGKSAKKMSNPKLASTAEDNQLEADVLGEADWNFKQQKQNSYLKNLSLFSFVCSILTIMSLLFKMKNAHVGEEKKN